MERFYRRIFRSAWYELKRYKTIALMEAVVIAALVAVVLCLMR